jgi:hypothetical protein
MRITGRFTPQAFIALVIAMLCFAGAPALAQEEPAPTQPTAQAAPPAPEQAQAQRVFRSDWDVIIDGKAEINGVLALNFEAQGGEAKLVRVNVLAKTKAKQIAKDLAEQLTFTVGANYKVKANDNKVSISLKNKKAPVYYLGIAEQALDGVSIRLTKG